jgi:hypothetical protein
MLTKWLALQSRAAPTYKFPVIEGAELMSPDEQILGDLARELVLAHGVPNMIKAECSRLLHDAAEAKLYILQNWVDKQILADFDTAEQVILEKYLDQYILPGKDKMSTRSGNFGEVIAAQIFIECDGFRFPIFKLRVREKKDWSPRLTDLCLVKTEDHSRPLILYGEVKTRSSGCNKNLAIEGHDSLCKDDALADPEILRLIRVWLYETERIEEADFFTRISIGELKYDTRHALVIVHALAEWTEEILEALNATDLDPRLIDFTVTLLLIDDLRTIMDECYSRTWLSVKETVHGKGIISDGSVS